MELIIERLITWAWTIFVVALVFWAGKDLLDRPRSIRRRRKIERQWDRGLKKFKRRRQKQIDRQLGLKT